MSTNKKTIMVVDDQTDARAFVVAIALEIGEFNFIHSHSGDNALELLVNVTPDLFVLDVVMPGMNGFSLFHELRKNEVTRDIPVIMLTGVSRDLGIKFDRQGVTKYLGPPAAFLDKPADPELLQDAIRAALKL